MQAGKQAVAGASISLYAAGLTGIGNGSSNLLGTQNFVTDTTGAFVLSGILNCPTATAPVYLVARGGTPTGASANNSALVLVLALGDCGTLSTAANVLINEASTVAAAWTLSQFFGANAVVGASATNLQGVRNAFSLAANLVDTTLGTAPSRSLPSSTALETAKLNTLADAISTCAFSSGGSNCSALFAASITGGSTPANTLDAALNIVRNPGANVSTVFHLASSTAPFQPVLSTAPNDWMLSLTYGKCTSACGGLNLPGSLAVDSGGNVWVANYFGGVVSEFSPLGVPASSNGFVGTGLYESYGITIDSTGSIWVSNEQSISAAGNSRHGSISRFNSSGADLSGNGYTVGGIYYPVSVAADSNGQIWVADYGSSSASLLASDGSAISGTAGYATSQLAFTQAVAVDANHNAWFAVQGGAARLSSANVVSSFSCCNYPSGVEVDSIGNVWLADYGGSSIVKLNSSGSSLANVSTASRSASPLALAIDSAGNVWTANYYGNSITALTGITAGIVSPSSGYGKDASLNEPYSIAVDAGGDLWLSNSGNNTLTEIVGVAAPVKTPTIGPPTQP